MMCRMRLVGLLLVLMSGLNAHHPAHAGEEVDLALVLAVDVSESMDTEEQELQRQGFIEAFRSPLVHDAIRDGMLGRIAVTYMEWAGLHSRTPEMDHLRGHRLQPRPPDQEQSRCGAAGDRHLR
jgi:hypothetical protein